MTARRRWAWTPGARALAMLALGLGLLSSPSPARAWDPSTTHLGMVERSMLDSAMHLRWMESSGLTRGLFTPLRLDPARLSPAVRRTLTLAMRHAHAASGAQAMGGPGACPGASAPESTRARCIEGDLWEMTALGWMTLGVVVETVPSERLLHHFVDRHDPTAPRWTDDDLPRLVLRQKHAKTGGSLAARVTGSVFEGSGRSALAWLEDDQDPWAPAALSIHLRQASLAADREQRQHHLAMALLCTGALLHVVQDLSLPAHARGDVSAMFLPLSDIPGDRGQPLQELARQAYGRGGLPRPLPLRPRASEDDGALGAADRGVPRAPTMLGHLMGHEDWPGLVPQVAGHFLSESTMPEPRVLAASLSPQDAAAALLTGAQLDPDELDQARLSAWPAEQGYVVGGSGRPLAAFAVDERGRVRLWLDRRVYRAQARHLIPLGVETGRSILDLVYAAWPTMTIDIEARSLELAPGSQWSGATLRLMVEDERGHREAVGDIPLRGETMHRVVEAWPTSLPERSQVIAVLDNPPGVWPAVVEQVLDLEPPETVTGASPSITPKARAGQPTTRATGARPPMRTVAPRDPAADPAPSSDATASDASPPESTSDATPEPEPDDAAAPDDAGRP